MSVNIGPFNSSIFSGVQMEPEITPMKTGKAKGWIGEYHWVSPPVTEKNKYDNVTEQATEWCVNQFGKSGARWFEKEKRFYFKDEKDMTLFILRWS
jgi:hypothetical protein